MVHIEVNLIDARGVQMLRGVDSVVFSVIDWCAVGQLQLRS